MGVAIERLQAGSTSAAKQQVFEGWGLCRMHRAGARAILPIGEPRSPLGCEGSHPDRTIK